MSYRIFTDATTDLTCEMMTGLPKVHVIPMTIEIGGSSFTYGPGGNLKTEKFYQLLREGSTVSTTQIPPAVYRWHFCQALDHGNDVLYLCFSSGLSGTYQSAEICMAELREEYPQRTILCLDMRGASVGAAVMVHEAARMQSEGKEIMQVYGWMLEHRMDVCHWFTVDDLEHLRRGGRIGGMSAAVGTMLQIKPLLHINDDGKLMVTEKPRGRRRAIERQTEKLRQGWLPELSDFVVIGHGGNPEIAEKLRESVSAAVPAADIHIAEIDPIIGAHTGPDMLAVGYWGSNR